MLYNVFFTAMHRHTFRVRISKLDIGRYYAVFQRQDTFYQAGNPGSTFGMAKIGFHLCIAH